MATQTPNLKLDLREAADIFNPLSTNANFETLDTVITEIRKKGGVPTYTTTASANLLKLSENPTPNETLFKFVAAGDANTWSYQETVNNIVSLDGNQKTVKAGEMYVAWVNAANAMVVIAWPDVVDAQTFDGKGPAEWASKAQLDAVNQTAANATTTAQAAATVANNAIKVAKGRKSPVYIADAGVLLNGMDAGEYELTEDITNAKLCIVYFTNSTTTNSKDFSALIDPTWASITLIGFTTGNPCQLATRKMTLVANKLTVELGQAINLSTGDTLTQNKTVCIIKKIVALF